MANAAVSLEGVWKRFRRGELHDSLRDLLPALGRGLFARNKQDSELSQRDFWALQDVSIEIARSEAVAIIGSNGAGKSTLLKLLSGIMQPTKGTVRIAGRVSSLIEVGAGFHPDLTGRENVLLNGTILGMTRAEIRRKFDAIVAFAGLEEFIDTPVKRYSSGMHARLGFAVAAHVEPDVLIVDEVLSVGDFLFQRKCVQRMTEVVASGATVLFVSHNLRAATQLCSRGIMMERGRVIATGTADEVVRRYLSAVQQTDRVVQGSHVEITNAVVRGKAGEVATLGTGEKAWIDVEVTAHTPIDRMAVVVQIQDDQFYDVFNTSTERLGADPVTLTPGQRYRCSFEVSLHLAPGTYYLSLYFFRYDANHLYHSVQGVRSFFVSSEIDVRGVANLHPRLVATEVLEAHADTPVDSRVPL